MKTIAMRLIPLCLASSALSGCMVFRTVDPNAKRVTAVDPNQAYTEFWFNQPAVAKVESPSYDTLWYACERAAHDCSFAIDRTDYRTGLLTTQPLLSRQFFEFWLHDVASLHEQTQSDLSTMRRVVHFQIRKLDEGSYVCEPKVVIERYALAERRITSVVQYRDAFSITRPMIEDRTEEGAPLRPAYWYAERRDEAMEHALADRVRGYVQAVASNR
ncbi:MAG: hypothetical protein JWP03_1260 [Phycisphaerales bacterium]|jgi:hypothetical protein|nr:hypothetical protein [Phycisphaerales bacterium]